MFDHDGLESQKELERSMPNIEKFCFWFGIFSF